MKRLLIPSFLILLLGCKTITAPELIAFVSARAGEAATIAVANDLQANPSHRQAYVTCVAALDGLMQSPNYSSSDFKAALAALPIKEFKGTQGALVLAGTVMVFDLLTMFAYDVTTAPALVSVTTSVRDGISQALSFESMARSRSITTVARVPEVVLAPKRIVKI